ncbi:MAG TPA: YetF domain-containing protein, partial [Gammaproteobacteria bacterium]|nr:YetF domain-containing protein [Gammaproteobacteria bacterium]
SVTGAFLLIVVLVGTDILLSLIKGWLPRVDRLIEGQPLVILRDGVPLRSRMRIERVDDEDILTAARELQGIDRLEDIERAVLERNGGISIVPRRRAGS